jgi:WD40 repeat protein
MKFIAIVFVLPTLLLAQAASTGKTSTQVSTGNCSFNVVNSGSGSVSVQYHGSCGSVDPKLLGALQKLLKQNPQTIENLNAYLKEKTVNLEHAESLLKDLQVEADRQRRSAQARELAAQADSLVDDQPDLSALLLIESLHRDQFVENDHSLRRILPFLRTSGSCLKSSGSCFISSSPRNSVFVINAMNSFDNDIITGTGTPKVYLLDTEHRKQFQQLEQILGAIHPSNSCKTFGNNSQECFESLSAYRAVINTHNTEINNFYHTTAFVVSLSADGKYAATGSFDGSVRIIELDTDNHEFDNVKQVRDFAYPSPLRTLDLSSNGQLLVAEYDDNTLHFLEPLTGKLREQLKLDNDLSGSAVFSSEDLNVLLIPYRGKHIEVLSASSGKVTQNLSFNEDVSAAALAPGGRELAISAGTILKVVSIPSLTEKWHLSFSTEIYNPLHLSISPDGRFLVMAGNDGSFQVYEMASGTVVLHSSRPSKVGRNLMRPYRLTFEPVAFSPDGHYIAIANRDDSISIFDLSRGKEIANLIEEDITAIWLPTVLPNNRLASYTVMFHQMLTSPPRIGLGHISAFTFSPDGKYLAVAYSYQEARAKSENETLVTRYPVQSEDLISEAYRYRLDDNETLITRYPFHSEDLISEACSRISRNLTQIEWKQYIGDEPYQKTCLNLP